MENLKPTLKNAVLAQCHMCLGYYRDGKVDCENTKCSLYSWMPYRKKEPDLSWIKFHPKRSGLISLEDIEISDKLRERGKRLAQSRHKQEQSDE
jgi:hypothetical protein